MSFPRYPVYKDSGVEWLGDMPEHWEARPIKAVARIENSGFYGEDEDVHPLRVPVATTAQIDRDGRFSVEEMPIRSFTNDERNRYGCRSGDILVVKSSGSATNIISGKAGLVREADPLFIFSNFLMRIQVDRKVSTPAFLYYFITSNITKQRVQLMCSSTTYPNLKVGEYISACISLPSVNEQVQIATFLDRETTKIDALIAEQKHLIELLQEKRQAVISHAVTKGLNPNAPMKDSGVEWLGEVPKHWDCKPVLGVARERDEDNKGMKEDNLLSLSYGNIVNKDINTSDGLLPESFENYQIVRPGDIVLRLTDLQNDKRSLRSALVNQTGIITSAYLALKPESIDPKYLGYLLRAYDVSKVFYSMGGGLRQSMKYGDIKRMPLVIPTKTEQNQITTFLDRETTKIDTLIAEQKRLIELLHERRSALISAAVTGQIDVRGLSEAECGDQ